MAMNELKEDHRQRARTFLKALKQEERSAKNVDYDRISEIQNVLYCLAFLQGDTA